MPKRSSLPVSDEDSPSRKRRLTMEKEVEKMSEILLEIKPAMNRKIYEETVKFIKENEPDITTITNTPMLMEDRAELLQLYEVYLESRDLQRIELRKQFLTVLNDAKKKYNETKMYTPEQLASLEKEILHLDESEVRTETKYEILNLQTTIHNKQIIYNHYRRMCNANRDNDEYAKLKTWLYWALSLPYDKIYVNPITSVPDFIKRVHRVLNEELYGMHSVKEQILLYLNSRAYNPNMKRCSLGLVGPPGVGKTTIVRLLASALNYPFEQISLGGVHTSDFFRGHDYTYIGAQPGRIVKAMCNMKAKNGIIFFDEYDKISENREVVSCLLHVTDYSQNSHFSDNYLSGIQIDLSNVWFFYSMNSIPSDNALADRIFYVNIDGYTFEDKMFIIKNHILRRLHSNMGWESGSIRIMDEACKWLIETYSKTEKGIRSLEFILDKVANRLNFLRTNYDIGVEGMPFVKEIGRVKFPFTLNIKNVKALCT